MTGVDSVVICLCRQILLHPGCSVFTISEQTFHPSSPEADATQSYQEKKQKDEGPGETPSLALKVLRFL